MVQQAAGQGKRRWGDLNRGSGMHRPGQAAGMQWVWPGLACQRAALAAGGEQPGSQGEHTRFLCPTSPA